MAIKQRVLKNLQQANSWLANNNPVVLPNIVTSIDDASELLQLGLTPANYAQYKEIIDGVSSALE